MLRSILCLFAVFTLCAPTAKAGGPIDLSENSACERLDVERLNTRPDDWLSDKTLGYIEGYISNQCETAIPNVTPTGRRVDLAYLNELLTLVPSASILKTQNRGALRVELGRAQIQRELKASPPLVTGQTDYSSRDVAVAKFLGCQIGLYMRLEICEVRMFGHMKKTSESLSFDQRAKIVDDLLLMHDAKKSHRLKLGVDPN